jgi:hypothetical protein
MTAAWARGGDITGDPGKVYGELTVECGEPADLGSSGSSETFCALRRPRTSIGSIYAERPSYPTDDSQRLEYNGRITPH